MAMSGGRELSRYVFTAFTQWSYVIQYSYIHLRTTTVYVEEGATSKQSILSVVALRDSLSERLTMLQQYTPAGWDMQKRNPRNEQTLTTYPSYHGPTKKRPRGLRCLTMLPSRSTTRSSLLHKIKKTARLSRLDTHGDERLPCHSTKARLSRVRGWSTSSHCRKGDHLTLQLRNFVRIVPTRIRISNARSILSKLPIEVKAARDLLLCCWYPGTFLLAIPDQDHDFVDSRINSYGDEPEAEAVRERVTSIW
ncbi:hypothetical protein BJ508DRAFT_315455 [Ascobolus immersus RN42]|uniref:Uncharacterized protein n=1 Tax=Ascobolus immersus RN42 TaxID=1160509 RepID=A0A3N4HPK4_ASCIM|nr:hypothetical protein BJ508DRAFT_315455 [Ascobolus immersus RN42]